MNTFLFASILLCLFFIIVLGLIYLFSTAHHAVEPDTSSSEVHLASESLIVSDRFMILGHQQLIDVLDLSPAIANIKANLGLSDENWSKDALPFLYNYIEFVQRLPASESHHHAGDGGLIKHTLDVASLALIASTAQSWPPNSKTEDIAKKTAVWRYGIMAAAILHDVGKTITSFNIELYSDAVDHDPTLWLPDAGNMFDTGKRFYRVEFPEGRATYSTHAEIAWTFFQAIVPTHVRQWIAAVDPSLMLELRSYLSGKKNDGQLQAVIKHADMASVARDLKAGSRQRFAAAKRTPLIEVVMDTLREMLADRGAHFSIATTAGGDLFRKGDFIFMMSKNVPDYIRQYLRSTQHRSAPSFPSNNQRIFDTLLEYGAIVTQPDTPFRAVTNIDVMFTRADGEVKSNRFSVLCFKAEVLYPDGPLPEEFKGILVHSKDNLVGESVSVGQPEEAKEVTSEEYSDGHDETKAENDHADTKIEQTATDNNHQGVLKPAHSFFTTGNNAEKPQNSYASPPEKHPTPEPSKKTLGSIDELLDRHNLIPTEHTEGVTDTDAAQQKSKASETTQSGTEATDKTEKSAPNKSTITLQHRTPPPARGKADSRPPVIGSRAARSALHEIFNQPSPKTKKQDSSALPATDQAEEGMKEIIAQRAALPTITPRPVSIHKAAILEELPALETLQKVELDRTHDETGIDMTEKFSPASSAEKSEHPNAATSIREKGAQFMQWLAGELADGRIPINKSGAPVHFIEEGMLLVTPAIFRDFAGGIFNRTEPESLGLQAQKGFEQLKLHQRTKRTALYRAIAANGTNKKLFYCYLIPEHNIRHIIQPASRPQNNTNIKLENSDLLNMEKHDE